MSKKIKILFLLVGLAVFIFLINEFGIENILINIKKTGWWMLPIIGIWFFAYLFNAFAWVFIIKPHRGKFRFSEIFSISLSGFALNYITPFINLGGEPYKIFALKEKLDTYSAVSSVLLYIMLHFLSSFVFWIIAIVLVFSSLSLTTEMQIILGAGSLFAVLGIWFFYAGHRGGIFRSAAKIIPRLPFIRQLAEKINLTEESLIVIDDQIIDFYIKRRSDFYAALFFEVAARYIVSVEFLFILHAVGVKISYDEAIYINAFSSLVMNLLFFMPFNLGVREGSLYFIVNILKISSGIGIYVGLMNRIRELFWIFIGLMLIQFRKAKPTKVDIVGYVDIK